MENGRSNARTTLLHFSLFFLFPEPFFSLKKSHVRGYKARSKVICFIASIMPFLKDVLYFNLDNFEVSFSQISDITILDDTTREPIVWNIDDDNTSEAWITFFDIEFHYTRFSSENYTTCLKFDTVIHWKTINCFAILIGAFNQNLQVHVKNRFVLYSSFFALEYQKLLPFTLSQFLQFSLNLDNSELYRLDICLDLPYTKEKLIQKLFPITNFFSSIGRDKKNPYFSQTYYTHDPQSSNNRKYLFRIYDKVLDTFKKKKSFLVPHLFSNTDVTRIELELRPEESTRILQYSPVDILDNKNNIISRIFSKYWNKNSPIQIPFSEIPYERYWNTDLNLKGFYLQYEHIPSDYLKRVFWYLKNILESTGYPWLFQVILNINFNIDDKILSSENKKVLYKINMNFVLLFLDNLISYIRSLWISENLIQKVLNKHVKNPKIKLTKRP